MQIVRMKQSLIVFFVAVVQSLMVSSVLAQPATMETISRSLEEMIERVSPGVVKIFVSGYQPGRGIVAAQGQLFARQRSTGSGVIVDPNGYIVTNAHVISGARRVQVLLTSGPPSGDDKSILRDGGRFYGAQVVGFDLETDLAVLKIAGRDLPTLKLADSDKARKGQLVFAFGSPLGLENSVSMGVISSVARQLQEEDPMIYIQTDASINPGNSGGPLVTASGDVVGINTMIISQSGGNEGLGFAAPSNIVRNVYEQIKDTGTVQRGAIGVKAQTLNPILAAALGIQQPSGVVLSDVYPGGPGEKAGLLSGDVIVELDGKPMQNARQFDVNLYGRRVGRKVKLRVVRGGKSRKIDVEVIERPDQNVTFASMVTPERNLIPELGVLALDLTPQLQQMLGGLRIPSGVLVAARSIDAPFWTMGILPGDVIHAINSSPVSTLKDLRGALARFKVYDPVVLHVERGGRLLYVAFEMEG